LFYLYLRWMQEAYATEYASWTPAEIATAAAPRVGSLQAATLLGMAIGGLSAGFLVRAGREKWPMVCVPIAFAPMIALFPYALTGWGYVMASLAGIGFAAMVPISIFLAQQLLPHRANLASSLMMGGAWTVAMIGPRLAEFSVSHWGLRATFLLTACGLFASGIFCLPLPRSIPKP